MAGCTCRISTKPFLLWCVMTLRTILYPPSHMTGITGIMCLDMQALYIGVTAASTVAEMRAAADTKA